MAYKRRRIDLEFQLGQGDFGKAGFDTVRVSGLRVSASVTRSGGAQLSELNMRVFGLSLDVMNKLPILNILRQYDARRNTVTFAAGDEDAPATCFIGNIVECWAGFDQPEAYLYVRAASGYLDLMQPVAPTSYKGAVDAAVILSGLAAQMNPPLTVENSGVSVTLSNPYLSGTLFDQIRAVAEAGGFNCVIDDVQQRLAIWPANGVRQGQRTLIGPTSGMVGYPTYTQNGIQLSTLYNPAIAFGTEIQVESQLLPAAGGWTVAQVTHDLESEMPDGNWFTRLECGLIGQATPILQAG